MGNVKAHGLIMPSRYSQPDIHYAIRKGNHQHIKQLLRQRSNLHVINGSRSTPLHVAAEIGDLACVTCLLEHDANVNRKDQCQLTPLHMAAAHGHILIVDALLSTPGLRIDEQDLWGWTPLQRAVINQHKTVASRLIEHGAALDIPDENKSVAMHVVASYGQVDLMRELLDYGAYIDCQDARGRTPLYLAVVGAYPHVVALLMEYGCDPSVPAQNEMTPVALSVQKGQQECLEVLLHSGAPCRDPDASVSSLVEMAIMQASKISSQKHSCYLHIAILLLQAGCEPRNSFRLTYRLVRKNNTPEFFHLLQLLLILESPGEVRSYLSSNVLSPAQQEKLEYWTEHYHQKTRLSDMCRRTMRAHLYQCHYNIIYTVQQLHHVPTALKNILLLRDA